MHLQRSISFSSSKFVAIQRTLPHHPTTRFPDAKDHLTAPDLSLSLILLTFLWRSNEPSPSTAAHEVEPSLKLRDNGQVFKPHQPSRPPPLQSESCSITTHAYDHVLEPSEPFVLIIWSSGRGSLVSQFGWDLSIYYVRTPLFSQNRRRAHPDAASRTAAPRLVQ